MRRSVERLDSVKQLGFDLNTGKGIVEFAPDKKPSNQELWKAIEDSGFTPLQIEIAGEVYKGPS